MCIVTSPQFYRSVAASLAWAEIGVFVIYPLCAHLQAFKIPSSSDSPAGAAAAAAAAAAAVRGENFKDNGIDLSALLFFRAVAVFAQACSLPATQFSVIVQTSVLCYLGFKWNAVIGADTASNRETLLRFLIIATCSSVVHLCLTLKLACQKPKKFKSGQDLPSSSSTPTPPDLRSSSLQTPLTSEFKSSSRVDRSGTPPTGAMRSRALNAHPGTMHWWPILIMPFRIMFYINTMLTMLPLGIVATTIRSIYQRFVKGKGSAILHGHHPINGPSGGYALQMVFDHPFEESKLVEVVQKLSAECGIDASLVRLDFEEEEPIGEFPAPDQARIRGDHYVTPGSTWLNNMDSLKLTLGLDAAVWARVWNGKPGKPTVIQMRLPGFVWDGTSCFNFTKEMCNRYAGGKPIDIYRDGQLHLSPAVKRNLDNFSFLRYLFIQQPCAITYNIHHLSWRWGSTIWPICGGPGRVPKATILNFSEEESARFARAVKARGIKPFAAMAHAAVAAHTKVQGFQVSRIIMQASMQTRAYLPLIKERNVIGDWLVGPVQRLGPSEYTIETAQKEYNKLIQEMTEFPPNGEVSKSFHAKAYGWYQHGASMFELHPYYAYDAGLWAPSVFFNNYGPRSINADIGLKSWNWGAPYYLCCNTICINGKNSIAMATQCLSQETLDSICDQLEVEMRTMMQWV